MFPMSILLSKQLTASSRRLNFLFVGLSRQLQKRLSAASKLEDESRAYPVVAFRGDAVMAWVDRFQHGGVKKQRAPAGARDFEDGGRMFVRGLERAPEIVAAYRAIPLALAATRGLLETVVRFLGSKRKGATVRSHLLELAEKSKNDPGGPGMLDALLGNTSRLPRIVAAGAAVMVTLADFLRALAASGGAELLTFGEGAHDLSDAFGKAFQTTESTSRGGNAAPRALHDTLRDVLGGMTFALLALPWFGLYLGPLFKKLLLSLRVTFVDTLKGFEAMGWDFRQTVLEVFFVSLESLRRKALDWLVGGAKVILSFVTFATTFAERYLFELFEGLHRVLLTISIVLVVVTAVIKSIGDFLSALFDLNLAVLLPGLPGGPVIRLIDLIDKAQAKGIASGGTKTTALEIRGGGGSARIDVVLSKKSVKIPKITKFPALFADLLGKGPGSLLAVAQGLKGMVKPLMADILEAGQIVLVDAESRFDQLRSDAGSLDLAKSFEHLVANSKRDAEKLLAPALEFLDEKVRPDGFDRMSSILAELLVRGGFDLVGASLRGYVLALDAFWRGEKVAEKFGEIAVVNGSSSTSSSPHKLSKRARLRSVRIPRVTIRAQGRLLDEQLKQKVAARVRRAVAEIHANGRQRLAEAQVAS